MLILSKLILIYNLIYKYIFFIYVFHSTFLIKQDISHIPNNPFYVELKKKTSKDVSFSLRSSQDQL
jgi:hypothetical protein